MIIVDIDLSYPSNHPNKAAQPKYDQDLYDFFAQYEANYCVKTSCPHILLARSFKPRKSKKDYFEQRLSFFSFWLFKYGVWLNFGITLVILELLQKTIDHRELVNDKYSQ